MGTGTHLGVEKFNLAAGIKAVHVPAGPNDAIADVIATHDRRTIPLTCWRPSRSPCPIFATAHSLRSGVSTARRSSLLPEVPTIAEAGRRRFRLPDLVWGMGAGWHSGRSG